MAISKILHMKDSGNSFHARHLKRALDYVMNPEKTQGGRLVGAINCQADMAFEQMMDTKKQFGKTDKRQGYHIILSFKEDEVEPDRAFEITQKFVAEYLGDAYEAVFVVHDNCYPAPLVLQIILISVKLNEGTDSDILMFFTAECLNRYLLVLSYQSYKNSRYLPDQSLTPAIITIRCTTTSLDREMLHQRYDNNYSTF